MAKQEINSNLSAVLLTVGLMITAVSVNAEHNGFILKHADSDKYQWRQVADDFSLSEYREIYRHNKRVIRSTVRLYSESAAQSIGLPEKARQLIGVATGAASSLLTNHDIRFRLNNEKTFALEVRDPAKNNRALYLNYKLKW